MEWPGFGRAISLALSGEVLVRVHAAVEDTYDDEAVGSGLVPDDVFGLFEATQAWAKVVCRSSEAGIFRQLFAHVLKRFQVGFCLCFAPVLPTVLGNLI